MKITKEASIGEYRFSIDEGYFHGWVSDADEPMFSIPRSEANELIGWLYNEAFGATPLRTVPADVSRYGQLSPETYPKPPLVINSVDKDARPIPSADELGNRSAISTTPIKIGDPFKALGVVGSVGPAGDRVKPTNIAEEMAASGAPMIPSGRVIHLP
jgi:hypothetical protein